MCVCVCVRVCVRVGVYCVYMSRYAYSYKYIHVSYISYTYIHICMYIYTYTCMCICTYIDIFMYIYTYTWICVYICIYTGTKHVARLDTSPKYTRCHRHKQTQTQSQTQTHSHLATQHTYQPKMQALSGFECFSKVSRPCIFSWTILSDTLKSTHQSNPGTLRRSRFKEHTTHTYNTFTRSLLQKSPILWRSPATIVVWHVREISDMGWLP